MKRTAWLWVLPWAVVISSNQPAYYEVQREGHPMVLCPWQIDACQDFVDAMNEAHERRTQGILKTVDCGKFVLSGWNITEKDCKNRRPK